MAGPVSELAYRIPERGSSQQARVITEGFLEEAVGLEAAGLGVRHLGSD